MDRRNLASAAPLILVALALLILDLAIESGRLRVAVTATGMTASGERWECEVPRECLRMMADAMPVRADPDTSDMFVWQGQ